MAEFFFIEGDAAVGAEVVLDERTAVHCVKALRYRRGAALTLVNGRGLIFEGTLIQTDKHRTAARVTKRTMQPAPRRRTALAVAALRQPDRMAWVVEKSVEMGATDLYILQTQRTLKTYQSRTSRLYALMQSALLQSQGYFLPNLVVDMPWQTFLAESVQYERRYLAHCHPNRERKNINDLSDMADAASVLWAVGPEGDFSEEEIGRAQTQYQFVGLRLSARRLRTETAALLSMAYGLTVTLEHCNE